MLLVLLVWRLHFKEPLMWRVRRASSCSWLSVFVFLTFGESRALWSLITLQHMPPIFPGSDGFGEKLIFKSKEKVIKESFQ